VAKEAGRISGIALDDAPSDRLGCPAERPLTAGARTVTARAFIDCSDEGDLMAMASVGYTWGRESREHYGDSLGGVRPILMRYDIDPYAKPGEPRSNLLPEQSGFEFGRRENRTGGTGDSFRRGHGSRDSASR
jgi:hypothetical protein